MQQGSHLVWSVPINLSTCTYWSNYVYLLVQVRVLISLTTCTYPKTYHVGNDIIPLVGTSQMPAVSHPDKKLHVGK